MVASNISECERPTKVLKLYEYEFCPYCRKVRETLNVLDLDCIIYPCPRQTLTKYGYLTEESRYRNIAKKIGGKVQFPLLVDENYEKPLTLYESDTINQYLWKKYGNNAKPPPNYKIAQFSGMLTLFLSNLVRCLPQYGLLRIPSRKPDKLLQLYEFESSPYCKRVREILSCLELPYLKITSSHGSNNRKKFKKEYSNLLSQARKTVGLIQVPLLVDPNTNTVMLESSNIVKYLLDTYKIGPTQFESWDQYAPKNVSN